MIFEKGDIEITSLINEAREGFMQRINILLGFAPLYLIYVSWDNSVV